MDEQRDDYHDICALMKEEITKCAVHIQQTEENASKYTQLKNSLVSIDKSIKALDTVIDYLKPLHSDIEKYIAKKSKRFETNVNNALRIASEIIPDAVKGIRLKVSGHEAWLETPMETFANSAEGSGYKGTTSTFLRHVVLHENQGLLQTLILDEPLAKVSAENSATLSAYLPIMCQNMQVILIEQKKEVYANADCVTYRFYKDGNYTTVVKESNETN